MSKTENIQGKLVQWILSTGQEEDFIKYSEVNTAIQQQHQSFLVCASYTRRIDLGAQRTGLGTGLGWWRIFMIIFWGNLFGCCCWWCFGVLVVSVFIVVVGMEGS